MGGDAANDTPEDTSSFCAHCLIYFARPSATARHSLGEFPLQLKIDNRCRSDLAATAIRCLPPFSCRLTLGRISRADLYSRRELTINTRLISTLSADTTAQRYQPMPEVIHGFILIRWCQFRHAAAAIGARAQLAHARRHFHAPRIKLLH